VHCNVHSEKGGVTINRYVPNQPFGWACFWKIIKNIPSTNIIL